MHRKRHALDTCSLHTALALEQLTDVLEPVEVAHAQAEDALCALIRDLQAIRKAMLAAEAQLLAGRIGAGPSERNLAHYLAFRRQRPWGDTVCGQVVSPRTPFDLLTDHSTNLRMLGATRGDGAICHKDEIASR